MLSLSFTDDEIMSTASIRSLHALYAGAPVEYRRIAPGEVGARRIGHFGFFRQEFAATLWPLVPRWLAGDGA
jgi:predicted alpha/beta hydrolase